MLPLPSLRQGVFCILLGLLFFSTDSIAQLPEDLEKMGKDAEGFQFHLKFHGVTTTMAGEKYSKISALLDKYKAQVPTSLQQPFRIQGAAAAQKPSLTTEQQADLKRNATLFFRELAEMGLSVWDLQQYKDQFKNKNPKPGDNPVDPKIAWKGEFEGIERTLMGGRTLLIMDVWKQTMIEFFNKHPESAGIIYGQMDIGSWVKMNVDGLGFAADIDFSTIATDPKTNQLLLDYFIQNLKNTTGLSMTGIDVVLTAHGLAGAEVFIGEWGKAFAEVDMLRRGKWKMLDVVKNENGQVTDIRTVEKEGKELFMQKAGEKEYLNQQKDPVNAFDPKEKYPALSMNMEPMLSLEMLRHAIHDVEHGPFAGGQKIIKMIKYTERSFFMLQEAGKEIPYKDAADYFSLTDGEKQLMTLCEEVIKNKNNPSAVATLLETFTGKKLDNNEQVNGIVDEISTACKKAMLKNANQAFGYRVRQIASIEDENQRYEEADKFLKQLEEEFSKGYREGGTEIPRSMLRAHSILVDLRAGKIPADMVNSKLEELNRLMEAEYKVDKSFVERLVGDAWGPVRKFLVERGYGPEAVQKLIGKFKEKFVADWRAYAPELAQKATLSTYEFANVVQGKLHSFNTHLAKTKPGKILSSEMLNQLDNAFALYDAWMSGKNTLESAKRVSWTVGTLWAQGKWPFLAIPLGIYNSLETKSIAPAAMAVAFYLFPMAGQAYMVTSLIDRIVVSNVRDYNFRNHLDRLAVMARTDGEGHIVMFKVPKAFSGLSGSADSLETEPDISPVEPTRTAGIKEVFYNPEFLYCPDIKYFNGLIPRKYDQFGLYETKLQNLMTLFSFDNEFIGYLLGVQKFKKDKEQGTLPDDEVKYDRDKMLDSLETGIEDHLWSALFTALESTKSAEKKGTLDALEAVILQIQDSLMMGDYNMKQIDSLSLLLKIRKQVQNDPMYKQALGNTYSAGTAYDRIAIPTMERYIQVYRQIIVLQQKIIELWRPFGVDFTRLQEAPFRLILMGARSGAPMLTSDPEKDLQLAIQCFEAHTKRAADIRMDLATALGRPIQEKTDEEHLRILGEFGLGFEHLVDADANGRSPLYKDETGAVVKKMQEYGKAYRDYLDKLKQIPAIKLRLQLQAETKTMETVPITGVVVVTDESGKQATLPAGVSIEWHKAAEGKTEKVAEGKSLTENADKKGNVSYMILLIQKNGSTIKELDKTFWNITIEPYNLNDPSKGVKLKLPAVIKQYDIADVSAEIPSALKGKTLNCSWGYEALEGMKDCNQAKIQLTAEQTQKGPDGKLSLLDSVTIGLSIEVPDPGKTYGTYKYVTRRVKYQHMSLNIKTSDIWEGGAGSNWASLKRKIINSPQRVPPWSEDKKTVSTASAYGTLNIKYDKPWGEDIKTTSQLQEYFIREYKTDNNKGVELKAFSLGDFKGYGVYTLQRYDPGGWSDAGYRSAGASSGFEGYVMKGKAFFKVNWWVGSSGAFDNSDKGWMMSMIKMLDAECQSIINGISLQPDGRLTQSAYTGPKTDGSDFPQVSIEPRADTIQPGTKMQVKAVIKNDKPAYGPYTYSWTGQLEGNGQTATAQLETTRPGKKTITVTVDGTIPPGSATLEYIVAPLKVKITRVSPSAGKIVTGMPVVYKAAFINPVPAGKKLQFLWQPHPEEKFTPFEGSGNETTVVFNSPGRKKIWVQVLDKTTAETITMGESDQLELEVEKPAFTMSFTPAKALPGDLITAKINTIPEKLEEVSYRWMPLADNAKQVKESADGSAIEFYAKDGTQVVLEALALVKGSGEELGSIKGYFNAEKFTVKTEGPKVQGPTPMVWKEGIGLVEVDKEIAVHQVVEFNTLISPVPSSTLTYNWQVLEGNAAVSNPASKVARVTALETGTIKLKVTVKDNNGILIGEALGVFNATISNEMIKNAGDQKKAFDDKMQKARQLITEGKLDDAVKLADELKAMNAKAAVPLMTELAEACKKAGKNAAYERDFILAIKRYEQALKYNPADATAKAQLEQNKKWQREWAAIEAAGHEFDRNVAGNNLPGAQKCINDLNKLQFNMPGQMGNKWSQEKSNEFSALLKRCDSAYTLTRTQWTIDFKAQDFENALPRLEAFKAGWTAMPASMKEIESSIQLCKMQIAEKKKIYADFLVTKSTFEKGLPIDPKQNATTIGYLATTRFSNNDPRQKEMLDFARGMDKKQKEITQNRDRAIQLKKEGQTAEAAGQKETALGKYRESVALIPDATLESRIKMLETEIANNKARKEKADARWNEGIKLTGKKKTKQEGLTKMKESLEWWSDTERVNKIRELEKEMNGVYSNLDVRGTWKHGNTETMQFTPLGNGEYSVTEKGFDQATGTLSMMGENGLISYTTKNGIRGQYLMQFATDGNKATGKWTDSRNESGLRAFTRISKPETPVVAPAPTPAPAQPTVTTKAPDTKKKKKSFSDILDGINKGLGKIDSTLSGKKPGPAQPTPTPAEPPVVVSQPQKPDVGVQPADAAKEEKIFDNGNIGGVSGGPVQPTRFTLTKTTYISRIENYHYYNNGKKPGTIAVKHSNGQQYGPWQSYGIIGQGGVQNAYWVAQPKIELPAGTYTVIDSDPATWSQNGESNRCGFTTVWTLKGTKPAVSSPTPAGPVAPATGTITGTVIRPDGKPAAGAIISTGGRNTTANSGGEFTFSNIPAGQVSLQASYNNHHHKTVTTTLAGGKTIRIIINLPADEVTTAPATPPPVQTGTEQQALGVIYGTVFKTREEAGTRNPYELEGVPLPGINVTISYTLNGQAISKSAVTDASGKFRFTGLPLQVVISVTSRGLTLKRQLTSSGPQYVQFGWDGEIEIK